jgi:hypothetical protein
LDQNWIRLCRRGAALFVLLAAMEASGRAGDAIPLHSKWDEELLKVQLHDVHLDFDANELVPSWQEISTRFLLRSVLFYDDKQLSGAKIIFDRDIASGKEVLEAFLAAYPEYMLTQDQNTGVIWLHPKSIKYKDILSARQAITFTTSTGVDE